VTPRALLLAFLGAWAVLTLALFVVGSLRLRRRRARGGVIGGTALHMTIKTWDGGLQ
jgi:hypothetical protein